MHPRDDLRTSPSLLAGLQDLRNNEAWQRFWSCYQPTIRAWARARWLNEADADEVVAAVLEKLVQSMPRFEYDPQMRFRAWLRRVVENAVADFYRQRQRRPEQGVGGSDMLEQIQNVPAPDPASFESGPLVDELDSVLQPGDLKQLAVLRARDRVQESSWQAFWQTAVEGRPGSEVARELGMTVAAVHVAKGRVSKILREEMARLGVSPE